jgi:hypothetical protein
VKDRRTRWPSELASCVEDEALLRMPEVLYFGDDRFIDAEEHIAMLGIEAIPSLANAWARRDEEWQVRFASAAQRIRSR